MPEFTPFMEGLITQAPSVAVLLWLIVRLDKRLESILLASREDMERLIEQIIRFQDKSLE